MAVLLVLGCVILFVGMAYVCLRLYTRFDREIINISHRRDNGKIEKREDGVYMYYNGEWCCLDKKTDAEITYVSPLDTDKIISDFNRGIRLSSMRGKML